MAPESQKSKKRLLGKQSFVPTLTGKQQNLPMFSLFLKEGKSLGQPPVVKAHQGVVQNNGRIGAKKLPSHR